jgi:hypothetical protein
MDESVTRGMLRESETRRESFGEKNLGRVTGGYMQVSVPSEVLPAPDRTLEASIV